MNKFKLLSLVISFSTIAFAESVTVEQTTQPVVVMQTQATQQDKILPMLSFKAQQSRAAELEKDASYAYEQEQIRQDYARKLAEAETRIKQEIGNNELLLSSTTAKVYIK